jgi:hypothetical protein
MEDHIPSWTDRIIYKINETKFKLIENDENEKYKDDKPNLEDIKEENDNNNDNYNTNNENKKDIIEGTFKLIKYNSMQNILFSDHKPVFAYFNVNIK